MLGTRAVAPNNKQILCPGVENVGDFIDALPVTFTSPTNCDFNVDGSDFLFTLNNGSQVRAQCATARPADENNEMQTILTYGNYFFPKWTNKVTVYPVKVEIDGHSLTLLPRTGGELDAHGLSFEATETRNDMRYGHETSHLRMVQAHLERLPTTDLNGEQQANGRNLPNSCNHLFPTATHRVQIILSGGGTVDGVIGLQPLMDKDDVFRLYLANGEQLPAEMVLGLADLGSLLSGPDDYFTDNDNFFDVCLQDDDEEIVPKITKVEMPCTEGERGALYPPCGNKNCHPCLAHSIDVSIEGDAMYWRNTNMMETNANCGVFQMCGGSKGDSVSSGGFMDDCQTQDFDFICDVDGIPCANYQCIPGAGCSLMNGPCAPVMAGPQLHFIKGGGANEQEWLPLGMPSGTGCHKFVRLKALSEEFMSECSNVGACMACSMENIQLAVEGEKAQIVDCPEKEQAYVTTNDGFGWEGECGRCQAGDRPEKGKTRFMQNDRDAFVWQLPNLLPYQDLPQRSAVYTGLVYDS